MKFDMGAQTLSTLMRDSRGSSQDLGTLIRQLVQAAEPLEGKFNGAGRTAFDQFTWTPRRIAPSTSSWTVRGQRSPASPTPCDPSSAGSTMASSSGSSTG
ncbi:hypothetical protein [Streptomyces griseofuscus]|uniref:hypothetical protein n=1 Tax=Streptomyces griseofuscus TaxID=146922 RepID=UPI0037FE0418